LIRHRAIDFVTQEHASSQDVWCDLGSVTSQTAGCSRHERVKIKKFGVCTILSIGVFVLFVANPAQRLADTVTIQFTGLGAELWKPYVLRVPL